MSAGMPGPGHTVSIPHGGLAAGDRSGNTWGADEPTVFQRSNPGSWAATVGGQLEPPKSLWQTVFTGSAS